MALFRIRMCITMRFVQFTIFTLVCLSSFCIGQRYGSRWYTPYRGYSLYRGYTPRQPTPPPSPSPRQLTPPPRQFPPPPDRKTPAPKDDPTCVRDAFDCKGRCPCLSDFAPIPPPPLCKLENSTCNHVNDCCGCTKNRYDRPVCRDGICRCFNILVPAFSELARPSIDDLYYCNRNLCDSNRVDEVCDVYGHSWSGRCKPTCFRRKILHKGRCKRNGFVFPTNQRQRPGEGCAFHEDNNNECGHCSGGTPGICTTNRCRCPDLSASTRNG